MASEPRIVVITGASNGIGKAAAAAFSHYGDRVYNLSRHDPHDENSMFVACDVTDEAQCRAAIDRVLSEAGRIDVLINNAGFGISGPVETTEISAMQRQFDVCLFGSMRVLKPALPALRQSKGTVLFTSSVAAVTPIPYQAFYSAAKAAINSVVMALRNELKGTGIRVAAVLPGDVKTDFTAKREKNEVNESLYPNEVRSVAKMEHDEQHGMSPDRIAQRFLKLSLQKNPKPFCSVGFAYSAVLVLVKLLPARLANWVLGKLYA
ncbi:MAG: SDR family NAD(P)-dependent oxidoreductase [Clostridia bacterium]|nr:SDR family NAD(P)-dependent oxidoreductase [Clostridia bacterium]